MASGLPGRAESASPSAQDSSMLLTPRQQEVIGSVERAGASLSLVGVFLVFAAYAVFKRLRTVPNTFILFASVANVGASIACLIGYSGIAAGDNSALCQAQAFLLEMFMQSDPWWSLAMAINVYLVFFHAANPTSFRRYLWVYFLICFGAPAVPAVVLLICQQYSTNMIYGNATLWCWIDDPQSSLRIWSYYLPIWVCILLSAVIYVAVGYHVFHRRNQLRNLTLSNQAKGFCTSDVRESADKASASQPSYYGTVTTEVQITAESSASPTPPLTPAQSVGTSAPPLDHVYPWASPPDEACADSLTPATRGAATSVPFTTISSISSVRARDKSEKRACSGLRNPIARFASRLRRLDPVKLAYLRTSFIFALSVLVTWTPSSINRVCALLYPRANYPLNLASAIVLPLQGVWNAVIYFTTSWTTFREEVHMLRRRGCRQRIGMPAARMNSFGRPTARPWGSGLAEWSVAPDAVDIEMGYREHMGTVRVARESSF